MKDNQDGITLDLKWKWIAHYAHENWEAYVFPTIDPITGLPLPPQPPEISTIMGPAIWTRPLSAEEPSAYGSVQTGSMDVTTEYEGGTPAGIPGFDIEKHHIGISAVRDAFGKTIQKSYPGQNVELHYNPVYGPGDYTIHPVARAIVQRGYITAWNKKGQSGLGAMRFVSCFSYEIELEPRAPGEEGI